MADYNYEEQLAELNQSEDHDKVPETTSKAAEGQSGELAGQKKGEGDAAAEQAKEAKRLAAAKADWEKVLGEKLGGEVWKQISKHVTYESFLGHAEKAVGSLSGVTKSIKPTDAGVAGGLMDEQGEADAVKKFADALMPAIQAEVVEWLNEEEGGEKVLGAIAEWIQEHPRTMLTILGTTLVGAAVGVYLANMDPGEFKQKFKIGKNLKGDVGVDIGPLQEWTIQAAHLNMEYALKGFTIKGGVAYDEEKGTTVEGGVGYKKGGFAANVSGKHNTETEVTTGEAGLSYASGGFTSDVKGTYTSEKDGAVIEGGVGYKKGGFDGSLRGTHNTDTGATTLTGSAAYGNENFGVGLSGTHNTETEVTTAKGNIRGKGNIGRMTATGTADVSLAEDGRLTTKINGGLDTGLFGGQLSAGITHATGGEGADGAKLEDNLRIEGGIKLGTDDVHHLTGWSEPETGAFGFKLNRSLLDGQANLSHTVSNDGEGNISTGREFNYNMDENRSLRVSDNMGPDGQSQSIGYTDKDLFGTGANFSGSHSMGPAGSQTNLGLGFNLSGFKNQLDLAMSDEVNQLGLSTSGSFGNGWTAGGDLKLNLDEGRLSQFGAQVGWKDPDQFKSFMLKYKGTWMEENPGYAHQFDGVFEYAMGNWATRLKGGVGMEGSQLNKANVDALVGYKLNENWALLGGAEYEHQFNGGDNRFTGKAGVQYKDVAIMGTYDPASNSAGVKLEIKLFSW